VFPLYEVSDGILELSAMPEKKVDGYLEASGLKKRLANATACKSRWMTTGALWQ
jgi:hypothetical protein